MQISTISFEDLMRECNYDDAREFRKILRHNNLPLVSDRKLIDRDTADKIANRLTGHNIDWYKHKLVARDLSNLGPLQQQSDALPEAKIEEWYGRILQRRTNDLYQDGLLGFLCTGGFLEGTSGTEFIIQLDPGINIFIGDRGAGKSTVLNLVGLLADSVSEEATALVERLLTVLSPETNGGSPKDKVTKLNRRVYEILRHYSVEQYVSFFIRDKKIFCYCVNLSNRIFGFYERRGTNWISVDVSDAVTPSILALHQGEVIRISENRDKFYLNKVLDALYPDLYNKRTKLAQQVGKLSNRFDHYYSSYVRININLDAASYFIRERSEELEYIASDIGSGYFGDESIRIVQRYIDQHYAYIHQYFSFGISWTEASIIEHLQVGEDALYCLYVGRIVGFLADQLAEIRQIRKRKEEARLATLDSSQYSNIAQPGKLPTAQTFEVVTESQLLSELDDIDKLEEIMEEGLTTLPLPQNQMDDELLNAGQVIVEFLSTRLKALKRWVEIYGKKRIRWNKSIVGLLEQYRLLLRDRIDLIREQERKSSEITQALNQDELELKVFTVNVQEIIQDHQREIADIKRLLKSPPFDMIMGAKPVVRVADLHYLANFYDVTIERVLQRTENLHKEIANDQHDFIFAPMDVELRQGNVYRAFQQLSFGQKSGIILKMVLVTTDKRLIIIDQPEDNLDATSIVNMVAPTVNHLGKDRQVIIATHNSNLVMGLNTGNLIVLESRGENGRLRVQGSPLERDVVREMMDVLEGGVPTFEKKMKMYEDFISRIRGQIQDMDITVIESSFRRRTIDKFRNFLQPVVSDKSLLDFVRHELKQRDNLGILNRLSDIRQLIPSVKQNPEAEIPELLTQLEKLSEHLNGHIVRLQDAIEDIRLMDTQAKPTKVDPFSLLLELNTEYMSKISTRDIQIKVDENLKNQFIYADPDHLRLVFRNLFNNSLRATEKRVISAWQTGDTRGMTERIQIELIEASKSKITLRFSDNGCGLPAEILEKLYVERCSTQKGRDHGLGGVIIRKLLELNRGSIRVVSTRESGPDMGTEQVITIGWENIQL